jgi:hypothetical protein
MKKSLLLFMFFFSTLFAQTGYVQVGNPVYSFLERYSQLGIIENYNQFEIPKTKAEVISYLSELVKQNPKLSEIDKQKLNYFIKEFSYDISQSTYSLKSLAGNGLNYLEADNPKYLFFSSGKEGSFFVNLIAGANGISKSGSDLNQNSVFPYVFGGELSGSFGNNLGFMIRGINGSYFGEKSLLRNEPEFDYNYKFNQSDTLYGSSYFDHSEGYLTYQSKFASIKIARDRVNLGYGKIKTILGNVSPRMDYLALNLKYKFMKFSFIHGKLLGSKSITSAGRFVTDKFFVYHRFAFDLSQGSQFGIGETVIYSRRGIDLSYLNPFVFYKSAEHANQDRDNSMLFADFRSTSLIPKVTFYLQFMLDDMDFSKIGTGWYGNQTLWNFGISSPALNLLPADIIGFQMIRIEPYFYTHRIPDNSFTNSGYTLTDNLEPNSVLFSVNYDFSLKYNLDFSLNYIYSIHGANKTSNSGTITNYGGDVLVGHRSSDNLNVKFLDGIREAKNDINFIVRYEPLFNYVLLLRANYSTVELSANKKSYFNFYFGFNIKI